MFIYPVNVWGKWRTQTMQAVCQWIYLTLVSRDEQGNLAFRSRIMVLQVFQSAVNTRVEQISADADSLAP